MVLASDYSITREGLRSLFRHGAEIEIVGEATTILATPTVVRELAPDVALIDVGVLARERGLHAVAEIAHDSPKSRVIILTDNSDLPYARSMLAKGVSGYVLQQSESTQLFSAVRDVTCGGKFIDPSFGNDLLWHMVSNGKKSARATLSRRELEVLKALAHGYTNNELAKVLKVSVKTVETYRLRIYKKLGLHNRADIVAYALTHRLLSQHA